MKDIKDINDANKVPLLRGGAKESAVAGVCL